MRHRLITHETLAAWGFLTPNVAGFVVFVAGPVIASFVLSFTQYDMLTPARFTGLHNYDTLLFHDPLIWQSLGNMSVATKMSHLGKDIATELSHPAV